MKIYISYNQEDFALAQGLAHILKSQGHEPITDIWGIAAGSSVIDSLKSALATSEVVVSLLTTNGVRSEWVVAELHAAYGAAETKDILILPVLVGDTTLPASLAWHQALKVSTADAQAIADSILPQIARFIGNRAAAQHIENETRQRIEENTSEYVSDAVEAQELAEKRYRRLGTSWYLAGALFLVVALFVVSSSLLHTGLPQGDWTYFALVALRGVIAIGILLACAKYSFSLGRSFTIESLKCADRLHAIAFGRFYLRVYGKEANWHELKEAFANWNIDRPSAFTDTSVSDFDPKILELLADLARAVSPREKS